MAEKVTGFPVGTRVLITSVRDAPQNYLGLRCSVTDEATMESLNPNRPGPQVRLRPDKGAFRATAFWWPADQLTTLPPDLTNTEEVLAWLEE